MDVMHILSLIYFFLPAYVANMSPVLCKDICGQIAVPLDRGRLLFGEPVLGAHKTWRGIIAAILVGTAVFATQMWLSAHDTLLQLALFDYTAMPFYLGTLMGLGVMLGDLCKSFLKRRIGIKPGKPWYIIDQIDYILGATLLTSPFFFPGWIDLIVLIAVSFILSIIVNHIAYWLRIRPVKW